MSNYFVSCILRPVAPRQQFCIQNRSKQSSHCFWNWLFKVSAPIWRVIILVSTSQHGLRCRSHIPPIPHYIIAAFANTHLRILWITTKTEHTCWAKMCRKDWGECRRTCARTTAGGWTWRELHQERRRSVNDPTSSFNCHSNMLL